MNSSRDQSKQQQERLKSCEKSTRKCGGSARTISFTATHTNLQTEHGHGGQPASRRPGFTCCDSVWDLWGCQVGKPQRGAKLGQKEQTVSLQQQKTAQSCGLHFCIIPDQTGSWHGKTLQLTTINTSQRGPFDWIMWKIKKGISALWTMCLWSALIRLMETFTGKWQTWGFFWVSWPWLWKETQESGRTNLWSRLRSQRRHWDLRGDTRNSSWTPDCGRATPAGNWGADKQEFQNKTGTRTQNKSQTLEWVQKNPKPELVSSSGSSPSAPLDLHSPAGPLWPPAAFHCQEEDKRQEGESGAVGDVTADLHGLSNSGEKKERVPGAPTLRTQTVNCSIISRFRSIWAEADACSVAEWVRTALLLKANFLYNSESLWTDEAKPSRASCNEPSI